MECALHVYMYIMASLQPSFMLCRFLVCRCRLLGASWWVHPHGWNPPLGGSWPSCMSPCMSQAEKSVMVCIVESTYRFIQIRGRPGHPLHGVCITCGAWRYSTVGEPVGAHLLTPSTLCLHSPTQCLTLSFQTKNSIWMPGYGTFQLVSYLDGTVFHIPVYYSYTYTECEYSALVKCKRKQGESLY